MRAKITVDFFDYADFVDFSGILQMMIV